MQAQTADQWWVADQGVTTGPFPTEHLRSQVKLGQLSVSSQVCRSGETQWMPLCECPEFEPVDSPAPATLSSTSPAANNSAPQWDYLVKYITDYRGLPEDHSELTQLGAAGWELAAVQHPYFYFKRRSR